MFITRLSLGRRLARLLPVQQWLHMRLPRVFDNATAGYAPILTGGWRRRASAHASPAAEHLAGPPVHTLNPESDMPVGMPVAAAALLAVESCVSARLQTPARPPAM